MPDDPSFRDPTGTPLDIEARPRPGRGAPGGGAPGGALRIPVPGGGGVQPFILASPTVERPPSASDFNTFDTLAARTAANTPALFPAAQVTLPPGQVGVIRSFLLLANSLLVTSDIRWTLLFNNSPVVGWANLTINPRAAGSVEIAWTPEETYIPVPEAATIDWRVRVNDGGTYQVSVAMHGWFYPSSLDVAARAAWAR